MEEPGGLTSMGSHRVGHDWSDLVAAAAAMDREAWRAAIYGVTKSQTGLSNWTELNWMYIWYKTYHSNQVLATKGGIQCQYISIIV